VQTSERTLRTGERCLKVSELTELIRMSLEPQFTDISVEGEISNFRPSSTGHCYFTLKDRDAVIQAVMFRNRLGSLRFDPADGQLVVVRGSLSVYAKRGTYQIVCEEMERAGVGDILTMLENRKRALAAEGLFDSARKKKLPLLPSRIAVVTSPTGAALKDILRVLRRRHSGIDVVILPAPVQGDGAGEIIASRIAYANRHRLGDVLIVGRGGGSLEDLLPFSEESVVRAIAASEIPVISAVGHEIDISLADLAADVRAPTPSAAAEIVSAARDELLRHVRELRRRLTDTVTGRKERIAMVLSRFTADGLERNFRTLLQPVLLRLDDAKDELVSTLSDRVRNTRHRLELLTGALESCSPYEILSRGYAVVTKTATGELVKAASQVDTDERITIRLAAGRIEAAVTETHENGEST
jgi:exodeoxyribonuclease VII large subunit